MIVMKKKKKQVLHAYSDLLEIARTLYHEPPNGL